LLVRTEFAEAENIPQYGGGFRWQQWLVMVLLI